MKKAISVLLTILILWASASAAYAAEIFPVPQVTLKTQNTLQNDAQYVFRVDCGTAVGYEKERLAVYAEMSKQYSDAALIRAGEAWLVYETVLLVQLETGGRTITVGTYPVDGTELKLTLNGDILPAMVNTRLYTHQAFGFRLRFCTALRRDAAIEYASAFVTTEELSCPATAHIVFDVPEDAVNPNPLFLFLPFDDYALQNPTRPGYTFAGWTGGKDGGYLNTVPADTEDISLKANWTPRTYKINYVLTTRPGYFIYVDNSGNPQTREYGTVTPLYDLNPPYGYLFCGWFTDADLSGEPVTYIPADQLGDVVLYAKWLTEEERDEETIKKLHWADPDGDGLVTAADARLALRAAVELETFTKEQLARVDFYGGGTVTAGTARQILRFAVELDSIRDVLLIYGQL